jgi:hypothetical protein
MNKRLFTIQLLVERTKDSSNFIGGEKKFVYLAFMLEANSQQSLKCLHGSIFVGFGAKSWCQEVVQWRKIVHNINGNPNTL